ELREDVDGGVLHLGETDDQQDRGHGDHQEPEPKARGDDAAHQLGHASGVSVVAPTSLGILCPSPLPLPSTPAAVRGGTTLSTQRSRRSRSSTDALPYANRRWRAGSRNRLTIVDVTS